MSSSFPVPDCSTQTDQHLNRDIILYCLRIRGYFYNEMRYINLRFTYLLTYLLSLTYPTYILRCTVMCVSPRNVRIPGISMSPLCSVTEQSVWRRTLGRRDAVAERHGGEQNAAMEWHAMPWRWNDVQREKAVMNWSGVRIAASSTKAPSPLMKHRRMTCIRYKK